MSVVTLTINQQMITANAGDTILQAAKDAGIKIPTLCYLDGLSAHGGCRICLVEIAGSTKLQPACFMKVAEGMQINTETHKLKEYRKMIVELLFAEGNHTCSICVANNHCELQAMAMAVEMDHDRFDYIHPPKEIDISHQRFGIDHNRCILCTRCVRVCDEIEGAHTWDVAGRGGLAKVIADLDQPWGEADSCTSCGKCFMACPTGAIFQKGDSVAQTEHPRNKLESLVMAKDKKQWHV